MTLSLLALSLSLALSLYYAVRAELSRQRREDAEARYMVAVEGLLRAAWRNVDLRRRIAR